LAIEQLRRLRMTQARIVQSLGVSKSTMGRVLAHARLFKLVTRIRPSRCCATSGRPLAI